MSLSRTFRTSTVTFPGRTPYSAVSIWAMTTKISTKKMKMQMTRMETMRTEKKFSTKAKESDGCRKN